MKCKLEKIIEDVQLLVSRIESRESATDHLLQQIVQVQSDLLSMRKYQEEVRSFNELSERLSNHPKGPLIRCLAAENKQLEQLQIENRALCTSLDEHQSALDLIMKKYRSQVTKLMQANQVETALKSSTLSSASDTARTVASNAAPLSSEVTNPVNGTESGSTKSASDTIVLSQQMTALAAMAQDVCDRGDAYAAELEAELHRLRSENAGLREILMISTDYSAEPSENLANLDPIPGASFGGYEVRHFRYLSQNRPTFGSDSNTPPSGRSNPGSYIRPFDAFSSASSYSSASIEPRGFRDELSMNRSNELDDKEDVVSIWDNSDDDLDKTYENSSSRSSLLSDSDRDRLLGSIQQD